MSDARLQRLYSAPCCTDCGELATVHGINDHYCDDHAVIYADGIAEIICDVAEACGLFGVAIETPLWMEDAA